MLEKGVAHFGDSAFGVVGEAVDHQRSAARAIPFESQTLIAHRAVTCR
jgi:hypothetical protein